MLTLSIRNLSVKLSGKEVIRDVSATLHGGEMVAVIGRNGAGKTTLIKAIARLVRRSGEVLLHDDEGHVFSERDIAYVPQLESVTSRLTVFETVLLGLVKDLGWKVTDEQIETVTDTLLELGLDELSLKPVCSLSGGQKQLVFMAQAFVSRPRVLLLDEPTSALDLRHQLVVMDLARRYTRQSGAVTLFVVHDLMLASRYGNRLLMLHEGRIRAFDAAERVLMPYLLGDVYDVEACVERTPPGFLNVIPVRPL
ncbi:ABC transporter ATP-binding protein [uncultured Mailhella sp.]|uniref:ABC transporter ATP-binding protein n=1 Tax=uncultured Mailhella sp. TaxID=1981031 RepID=UPI0025DA0558|nr:ABC transporter ATP-binding protein [uncultured Mailhella sp.]